MPKRKQDVVRSTISMPAATWSWLQILALERGWSASGILTDAIEELIRGETPKEGRARMRGQGRIYRQRKSRFFWIAYCHGGEEIRESSGSYKEADAKRLLKKRLGEILSDRFVGPQEERVSFSALLDLHVRDYELNGRKNLTSLKGNLKHLREAFGLDRAVEVTEARIERYKEERLKGGPADKDGKQHPPPAAPATVNRELSALNRAFVLGVDQKLISSKPKVKKLREDNAKEGFVSRSEFEAICAHLPDYLQDFARFAFLTGWRKGEVSSLSWADVDLAGRTLRLRGRRAKSGKRRHVALEGDLLALAERRRAARSFARSDGTKGLSELVFHYGGGLPIKDFRKAWDSARTKANLPDLNFHDFRRSAVRNLVRSGVSQAVAMAITGHATDSVFRRYDITSDEDLREAVLKVQAYLDAQPVEPTVIAMPDKKQA
jgi:integrase